jgi:hypothetical protein
VSRRTTLTLDDDVADALRREAMRTGRSFRSIVNEALRAGLERAPGERQPFTVQARELGLRTGLDLDDVEGLLDRVEGSGRR